MTVIECSKCFDSVFGCLHLNVRTNLTSTCHALCHKYFIPLCSLDSPCDMFHGSKSVVFNGGDFMRYGCDLVTYQIWGVVSVSRGGDSAG